MDSPLDPHMPPTPQRPGWQAVRSSIMSVHTLNGSRPVTVLDLRALKEKGERFAMLTAYDFLSAQLLDEAGIPIIHVGDSLGMVVLGYDTTIPVTVDELIHHTRAVRRGA